MFVCRNQMLFVLMRILVLNYEYPPLGGGAGVICKHIAEGLAIRGNQVSVITTWFKGENEYSEEQNGQLQIYRLKSKRKFTYRSNIREMISWINESKKFVTNHLEKNKYDLTFANFSLPGGEVADYIYKLKGIPFVIISHGHDIPWFFPKQMFFYHLLTYYWIKKICNDCSALFVQSGDMLHNAQKFLGKKSADKVIMIPNGADFLMFYPDESSRAENFMILFSGRLVKQKGPTVFLDALKRLHEKQIPFEAMVVGDGPMRKKMESYVNKNNLEQQVVFKGWIEKELLVKEYRSAHVMVAPSLNEGMSMAMNEALATGLYVITTPVSCNQALINEGVNGEILTVGNSIELAERLAGFYKEKYMADYRVPVDAIKAFTESYRWDRITLDYEKVFEKVIKERKL
jgi:glycosyltransferase involved in cell wall biosynthesis